MSDLIQLNSTTVAKIMPTADLAEIGDRESTRFKPHLKLKRWGEENFVSFELESPVIHSKHSIDGEAVNITSPNVDVRIYPLERKTVYSNGESWLRNELGGFEYEVKLKKKAAKNEITFKLDSKDVTFYPQPELSDEEKTEGCVRPDDAINSICIYKANATCFHSSKELAEKYRVGKVGTIYRPKATDAKGAWTWGKLQIEGGLLKVAYPQDWLDKATYPVISHGVNFGYETIGGTSSSTFGAGGPFETKYTSGTSAGTGDSISVYSKNTGTLYPYKHIVGCIYDDSSGSPGSPITDATTTPEDLKSSSGAWVTSAFPTSPDIAASTVYHLAHDTDAASYVYYYYDSGDANQSSRDTTDYGSLWPTPWSADNTYARKHSVYCTYTAAAQDYPKSSAVSLGLASTAIRVATLSRTPSLSLGLATTVSRAIVTARSVPTTLGLATTASKLKNVPKTALSTLGLTASGARSLVIGRSSSPTLGLATTVSRIAAIARTASTSLGFATSISKALKLSALTTLGLVSTATRALVATRTGSVVLGFGLTVAKLRDVARSASIALGLAVSASRAIVISRTASPSLGLAASAFKSFIKSASVTIGLYTIASTLEKIKRLVQSIGTNRTLSMVGTNRTQGIVGTNRTLGNVGTNREVSSIGDNRDLEDY